jgi:hypothetical protein
MSKNEFGVFPPAQQTGRADHTPLCSAKSTRRKYSDEQQHSNRHVPRAMYYLPTTPFWAELGLFSNYARALLAFFLKGNPT